MFKKLLIAVAVTSSSVAFANAPYVGASIGVNDTQVNTKTDAVGASSNLSTRNPNFDLFGGYGAIVNQKIYLGGEVFINTATGDAELASAEGASLKYETRYTYGISFIPGLMLSEKTMVYGRAGLVRGNFDVDGSVPGASTNENESVSGAQAGVGLQTNLTNNLDLRGEYVYSDYRSFNIDGVKFSPTSDQFNVGLVYKFE